MSPRAIRSVSTMLFALATAFGCVQEAATQCGDGQFCPAGTRCGPNGCAVKPDRCADFAVGSRCERAGGEGRCRGSVCEISVVDGGQPDATAPPDPVRIQGTIRSLPGFGPQGQLTVRVEGNADVVAGLTSTSGRYTLAGVRPSTPAVLRIEGVGFISTASRIFAVGDADYEAPDVFIATTGYAGDIARLSGVTNSANAVTVGIEPVSVDELPNARVTVSLPCGVGPIYFNEGGLPDPLLTGPMGRGAVLFDCPDVELEVAMEHPTLDCALVGPENARAARLRVFDGVVTFAGTYRCLP